MNIYTLIVLIHCIHMKTQKEQTDKEIKNKKSNLHIDSWYINK